MAVMMGRVAPGAQQGAGLGGLPPAGYGELTQGQPVDSPMSLLVRQVHAAGYRSLRKISFPVDRLTVFLGANGVGKTNLYRALQLIQAAAAGTLARELAAEGGMESAFWAGERPQKPPPVRITLGAEFAAMAGGDRSYAYEVSVGLRHPTAAALPFEPLVKEETLTFHHRGRRQKLLERRGPAVTACNESGRWVEIGAELLASETALGSLQDPAGFPDLHLVRRTMLDWRFYHGIRQGENLSIKSMVSERSSFLLPSLFPSLDGEHWRSIGGRTARDGFGLRSVAQ